MDLLIPEEGHEPGEAQRENREASISKSHSGGLQPGIALALSGGGYRAMLFHLGALWRLNEVGILPRLSCVSSVSGGSIVAGVLGLHWEDLGLDQGKPGLGQSKPAPEADFQRYLVRPLRALASHSIDWRAVLCGALGPGNAGDWIARSYAKRLFGGATLQNLPDQPRFVFNATNVQSGALCRLSKAYLWDYKIGEIERPTLPLSRVVAASSAFPPFLSPLVLRFQPGQFKAGTGMQKPDGKGVKSDVYGDEFRRRVVLTDGGIYDNLGLEPIWKNYQTLLVSDGGGRIEPNAFPEPNWLSHTADVLSWTDNQVRSLRKRQLVDSLNAKKRSGAYWGIHTRIADYELPDALPCPPENTEVVAKTATRLKRLDATRQEQLINWGYAVCDAALRCHFVKEIAADAPCPKFPYSTAFPLPSDN